jgi:hypothetical protein
MIRFERLELNKNENGKGAVSIKAGVWVPNDNCSF